MEHIADVKTQVLPIGFGPTKFLINCQGYTQDANSWEPYENVTKDAVTEYLKANGKYDHSWKFRCPRCDKPYRTAHGAKVHYARSCKRYDNTQRFHGTVAKWLHTAATLTDRKTKTGASGCVRRRNTEE